MGIKQIILQKGLPFEVKLPSIDFCNIDTLTEEQLHAEMEKGYSILYRS